jgi:hypothetical protein
VRRCQRVGLRNTAARTYITRIQQSSPFFLRRFARAPRFHAWRKSPRNTGLKIHHRSAATNRTSMEAEGDFHAEGGIWTRRRNSGRVAEQQAASRLAFLCRTTNDFDGNRLHFHGRPTSWALPMNETARNRRGLLPPLPSEKDRGSWRSETVKWSLRGVDRSSEWRSQLPDALRIPRRPTGRRRTVAIVTARARDH